MDLLLLSEKNKSEEDAEEMVQLTFIKIWQYRASLSTQYSFEVQLFTTARSVLINDLRKKAHERNLQKSMQESSLQIPVHSISPIQLETDNHLQVALHQLPLMRRKVFELNRLQRYSYKEIAGLLTISVKTVDNHLSQTIKQLKALLLVLINLL